MTKIFYMLLLLPVFAFSQTSKKPKAGHKTIPLTATVSKPLDGFTIDGIMKGFPEGTKVALLNGQTGAPESETVIKKDKFSFNG